MRLRLFTDPKRPPLAIPPREECYLTLNGRYAQMMHEAYQMPAQLPVGEANVAFSLPNVLSAEDLQGLHSELDQPDAYLPLESAEQRVRFYSFRNGYAQSPGLLGSRSSQGEYSYYRSELVPQAFLKAAPKVLEPMLEKYQVVTEGAALKFSVTAQEYPRPAFGAVPAGPWHVDYDAAFVGVAMLGNPADWQGGNLEIAPSYYDDSTTRRIVAEAAKMNLVYQQGGVLCFPNAYGIAHRFGSFRYQGAAQGRGLRRILTVFIEQSGNDLGGSSGRDPSPLESQALCFRL